MAYPVKSRYRHQLILLLIPLLLLFSSAVIGADNVVVIRGKTAIFNEVLGGIKDDIDDEVSIIDLPIDSHSSVKDINKLFDKHHPRLVILIGNKAVNLYAKFQSHSDKTTFPPAIALAALYIDQFIDKLHNTTAIRYEIPAVTSIVAIRTILGQQVKKVGVIYRAWMRDIINENRAYCLAEGVEIVGIELPNKMNNANQAIKNALQQLNQQVDVLWIVNDNSLLTEETLVKAWLPASKTSKLPSFVGVKQFITKIPLGSFAIVPDNYGLGAQAADILFDIMENNWQLESHKILQPISVKKYINTTRLKNKGISYQNALLTQMEEVMP